MIQFRPREELKVGNLFLGRGILASCVVHQVKTASGVRLRLLVRC